MTVGDFHRYSRELSRYIYQIKSVWLELCTTYDLNLFGTQVASHSLPCPTLMPKLTRGKDFGLGKNPICPFQVVVKVKIFHKIINIHLPTWLWQQVMALQANCFKKQWFHKFIFTFLSTFKTTFKNRIDEKMFDMFLLITFSKVHLPCQKYF